MLSHEEISPKIESFVKNNKYGIVEILGATASGKTGYSIRIAKELKRNLGIECEIISVDSRQVYHDFNIGAAKVTEKEMEGIPHHGLNLIYPHEVYNVYQFQQYVYKTTEDIHTRGKRVILAGGTMLWLDAISENYIFDEDKNKKSEKKGTPLYPFFKIGIEWDRKKLYERCDLRAQQHFANGLIEETRDIIKKYNPSKSAFTSFGYQEVKQYLDQEINYEEALEINQKRNRNYAKRQLTWWRGREDIVWVDGENLG